VSEQHKGLYKVWAASGEHVARLSGRFRHKSASHDDYPAVGDWVALGEGATIVAVYPRRTAIRRKRASKETKSQVIAANVDTVFVVTSLNADFNPRRLERFLTVVWESGAKPAVILTKSDLCEDLPERLIDAEATAFGVPVHAVCAPDGNGLDALAPHLGARQTVALIGSSGVGKSTLVNALVGAEVQVVKEIRNDKYRGRHTTTSRHLLQIPGGAMLVDTPGLREISLWDGRGGTGLSQSFDDVETFAARCRFRDCSHQVEPGCAIRAALESGELDAERWESHEKLRRELAHLDRKQREREKIDAKRAARKR